MNVVRGYIRLAWERRPEGLTLAIALAALAGAGNVMARQIVGGPTLFGDSIFYIAVARSLLAGDGFVGLGGQIYITNPPLYQLLLVAGGLAGIDPHSVAGPLNAGIFALTIFTLGRYLQRRLASRYLVAWACFAIALSLPMAWLASAAMTGTLFILLATLALTRTDDYLAGGKTSALLWAAVFGALAWQARYIGVVVPASVGLALLLQAGAPLRDRLRRGAIVRLAAGLPMTAWLLRNYLETGRFATYVSPVDYSLSDIALAAAGRFWDWVYFNPHWVQVEGLAFLPEASAALLLAALGAIAVGCVLARGLGGETSPERSHAAGRICRLFGGFAAVYVVLVCALFASGRPHNGFETRLLTPLYLPLVVIAAVGVDRLVSLARDSGIALDGGMARRLRAAARLAGAVSLVALTLWLSAQVVPNARAIAWHNSDGFSDTYGGRQWAGSQTLRHIRENPMNGEVRVNHHYGMAFLHNGGDARHFNLDYRYYEANFDAERLTKWAMGLTDGAWLVWFKEYDGAPLLDKYLPYLRAVEGLRPVVELPDGAIFRVDKDYRPAAAGNPYIAAYEGIAAGELGASAYSDFSAHWDGDRVIYFREPCVAGDIDERFLLHIFPADTADLPAEWMGRGFVNADFDFAEYGALFEGKCVGIARLPDYGVERVITGQYVKGGGVVWRVDVGTGSASRVSGYLDAYRAAVAGEYGAAAARSDFDVYRAGDDALVYVKEPCVAADLDARFFLHIIPADAADLPAERMEVGFDNLDFRGADGGEYLGGKCVARAALPDYAIERIRTGQFVSGEGEVWRVEFGGR